MAANVIRDCLRLHLAVDKDVRFNRLGDPSFGLVGCLRHSQYCREENGIHAMKNFKQLLVNLAIGFVALNIFGVLFCTGESFPVPISKTVTVTLPSSVP